MLNKFNALYYSSRKKILDDFGFGKYKYDISKTIPVVEFEKDQIAKMLKPETLDRLMMKQMVDKMIRNKLLKQDDFTKFISELSNNKNT